MPLVELPVRMWTGLSTDTKPPALPRDQHFLFYETDSGRTFVWASSQWRPFIHGNAPELRWQEDDQTDPAGRYRAVVSADAWQLERASTVSWGASTALMQVSSPPKLNLSGTISNVTHSRLECYPTLNFTVSDSYYCVGFDAQVTATGTADNTDSVLAVLGDVFNSNGGTLETAYGVNGEVYNQAGTGRINAAYGVNAWVRASGGTVATGYGLAAKVNYGGTGTVNTGFGVYIDTVAAATAWGIYQLDSGAKNYLAGALLIGGTAYAAGTPSNLVVISNGTAPTASPADTVTYYSTDISAGNTCPSFYTEGTAVVATGQADSVSSVRVQMRVNGTLRTFLCI